MAKKKDKWIIAQERGGDIPLGPPMLVLFRMFTDPRMRKWTGVAGPKIDVLIDLRQEAGRFLAKEKEWERFCQECYLKVIKDHFYLSKLRKKYDELTPAFLRFVRSFSKIDFRKKSKKELWRYYNLYVKMYENLFPWAESPAFGSRYGLEKDLREYLEKKLKKINKLEKFDGYFEILITPREKSFILKEEEDLLKIAAKIEVNKKIRELFQKPIRVIKKQINKFPQITKLVERHLKKFTWVPYNYGSNLWNKEYFLKKLVNLMKEGKAEQKLKELQNRYRTLSKKQKNIFLKLKIEKSHQELFQALQTNGYLIDRKKEVFTESHYCLNYFLLPEIAKRLKLEMRYVQVMIPEEVKKALLEGKILTLEKLKERWDFCVILCRAGKIELHQGNDAARFLRELGVKEEKEEKIIEIKGQIAFPGKVKGIVKVIPGAKDIKKIKKGDILVTFMTTPDFAPAFKKIGAIVTNEGGITCHAAIVSRELRIPCIIGTKKATKVLKDGDLVEVDATKGIVKILNK